MSLQVWLPLQGDLHNQGLLNIDFINGENTITVDNNGKLGKCCSFNYDKKIGFTASALNSIQQFSICFWINPTDWSRKYITPVIFSNLGNWDNSCGFSTYNTNNSSNIAFMVSNGSGDNNYKAIYFPKSLLPVNTWSHIVGTYDGRYLKVYINGALKGTGDCGAGYNILFPTTGRIGGWNVSSSNYGYSGKINDVRLYNHALSPKEVEEIAKGLVLHYKLDDKYIEGTTNLLSAANSFPEPSNGGFSSSNTVYGQYFYIGSNSLTTYTGSAYINNTSNLSIYINIGAQKVSDNSWTGITGSSSIAPGQKGWLTVTTTITSTYKTTGLRLGVLCNSPQSNLTSLPTVQYLQLEKKDHATPWTLGGTTRTPTTVYDSSGYSNNGTIVGSLTAAAPSPRYEVATTFSTEGDYFYFPHLVDSTAMNNEFTFSCWLYRDYTDATARYFYYGLCTIYLYTDFKPRITWLHASADLSYNSTNTWAPGGSSIIPLQEWTHLVFTFKNGILCCYENGQQMAIDDRSANGTYIRGTKGSPNASIGYTWIGKISDVRTYATALTAAQVKELYTTSMSIDSSGNVYARELVEL